MTNEQFLALFRRYAEQSVGTRYRIVNDLLIQAWCRETAHPDNQADWTLQNCALGQCAVSALVAQDLLGGGILHCVLDTGVSHYANLITIGEEEYSFDCTRSQFPAGMRMPVMNVVSRDRLLHSSRAITAGTPERYVMLRDRVAKLMNDSLEPDAGC